MKTNYENWQAFFDATNFTFFRTSQIQKKYIEVVNDNLPAAGKALEIAGGSGYTSIILADLVRKRKATITYSDLDQGLVDTVHEIFGGVKNLKFRGIDSATIPYENQYLDVIFHQGFLEHFTDEQIIAFLREQSRAAKVVVFDVPNGRRWSKVQEFGNERFLSHSKWQALVRQAGLNVYKATARRFANPWKKYVPTVLAESEWFHQNFGESSIIVCGRI